MHIYCNGNEEEGGVRNPSKILSLDYQENAKTCAELKNWQKKVFLRDASNK